jgi:hypothetical protein
MLIVTVFITFIVKELIKILQHIPEGKRPLGRPRRRWDDNVKIDVNETGYEVVVWIHLAQDVVQWWDLMNTVMNLLVP